MSGSTLLGLFASVVFLARLLPQPVRTLRTGQVTGLSALASMNALVADAAWLIYGFSSGLVEVWAVSVPAIAASGWTVALLRRAARLRDLVLAGVWLAVVVACAATGALTAVLALAVAVTCGPALWSAYTHQDPQGISAGTWWIAVVEAAAWGAYGVWVHSVALELYGVTMVLTAAAVLGRLGWLAGRYRTAAAAQAAGVLPAVVQATAAQPAAVLRQTPPARPPNPLNRSGAGPGCAGPRS